MHERVGERVPSCKLIRVILFLYWSEGFTDTSLSNLQGTTSPRGYPSFESLGLNKSAVQQRVNQITRELHVMEEQKDLQRLRLDRMERLAQSVLSSGQSNGEGGALHLLTGATGRNKRQTSTGSSGSRSDASSKKPKTS